MSQAFRRILTQKEMRTARSEIDFCYLCGKPLPPKGPGRSKQVVGEHVVPRKLLGDAPERDAWAVELDVHRGCEQKDKQAVDGLLGLLQKMNIEPESKWPAAGYLRRLDFTPMVLTVGDGSLGIPAFGNAEPVLKGAWTWVRGIHAALYREFLPPDGDHRTLPPVPACSTSGGEPMALAEKVSFICRAVVQLGVERGKWEGINAWRGQLKYRCVWKDMPEQFGGPAWHCFWGLLFPGVLEWSRTVLGPGAERPWHGHYRTQQLPDSASFLVSEGFPKDEQANVQG